MTQGPIAVVGGAGSTGHAVLRHLLAKGRRVRAITRTPAAGRFAAGAEPIAGDLSDPDSLASAFAGCASVHYIPPSFDPREVAFMDRVVIAAEAAGVPRVVYHSVLHPGTPELPHHLRKAKSEHRLRHSRLDWTILQPAMYSQTALAFLDAEAGTLMPAFDTRQRFAPIDLGDLAEVSALMHLEDRHRFATYELAGAEVLTFEEIGAIIGAVLGRSITTRQAATATLSPRVAEARGYDAAQARELDLMCEHYDRNGLVGNGNVLKMILGREPTGFEAAMRRSLLNA